MLRPHFRLPRYRQLQATWLLNLALLSPTVDAAFCNPFEPKTLAAFEASLAEDYPDLRQLSPEQLLASDKPPLLLDVRKPEEFAISHLAGAIQVDPDASSAEVRRLIGTRMTAQSKNVPVVFYCSVGYRSSKLAERVRKDLKADGISTIANLRGGIFAWANQGLPVVDGKGPTRAVHPFDDCRAPLLNPPSRVISAP